MFHISIMIAVCCRKILEEWVTPDSLVRRPSRCLAGIERTRRRDRSAEPKASDVVPVPTQFH